METETYTPTRREQILEGAGMIFFAFVGYVVLSFGGAL